MRTWKENVPSWPDVGQIKCEEVKTTYEEDDDSIIFHNPELGNKYKFGGVSTRRMFQMFKKFSLK